MRRLALVVPFLVGPFAVRLAIGPISNAIAGAAIAIAPAAHPSADIPPIGDESEEDESASSSSSSTAPKNLRIARRERRAYGAAAGGSPSSASGRRAESAARFEFESGAGVDTTSGSASSGSARVDAGGPPAKMPSLDGPTHGTIVVPASVIAKAIEKKDVGATNATTADGRPLGARIHGANRYRTALRDGDVIVFVAGTRTETTKAMVDAAMRSLAGGATKLSGKILRAHQDSDEIWDVVLELPPRD